MSTHRTSNHIEIEDSEKPVTVTVNAKDYETIVVRVLNSEEEEIHCLEVEDWNQQPELEVIE